jgi:predicted CopG family antitoxin
MATKTITLELDAYEKLRRAKRAPSESFSSVVRRAEFPNEAATGRELMHVMEKQMREGRTPIDEATLDRLDAAQRAPQISSSEW